MTLETLKKRLDSGILYCLIVVFAGILVTLAVAIFAGEIRATDWLAILVAFCFYAPTFVFMMVMIFQKERLVEYISLNRMSLSDLYFLKGQQREISQLLISSDEEIQRLIKKATINFEFENVAVDVAVSSPEIGEIRPVLLAKSLEIADKIEREKKKRFKPPLIARVFRSKLLEQT